MRELRMTMTEPQARFFALPDQYPLFCGGYGTGKTETMLNCAIRDALEAPGGLIALYEPTFDLIQLILAPRLQEKLTAMGFQYHYHMTKNMITVKGGQCANFVMRTLDNPARIVGYESYRAHIDEIDTLRQEQATTAWRKIIARNRQIPKGGRDLVNKVSAYTTPEGFRFAYNTWVRNKQEGYAMVQASSYSNPWLKAGYIDGLKASYPPQLVKAYIDGQFVNMTSGSVYPDFDRTLNHTAAMMEPKEPLHVGMDFNVNKMAAVVFVIRNGQPLAVAEVVNGRDTPTVARILKERFKDNGHDVTIYPDSAAQGTSSKDASMSDIGILKGAGFRVLAQRAHSPVKDRVNSVNAMILNAEGQRRMLVNTELCPRFTECLEQQPYDDNGEPDKKSDHDHANDAAGYFIEQKWPVVKPTTTYTAHVPHFGR